MTTSEFSPAHQASTRPWSCKRRDFLRILGGSAGAAILGPMLQACKKGGNGGAVADDLHAQLMHDDAFWISAEQHFTLPADPVYMNVGTSGALPRTVLDLLDRENRSIAADPTYGYLNAPGILDALRTHLAPGLGVEADEVALTGNTSSGLCHAILGLAWRAGDVVVTSNHEHPSGNIPLQIAHDRYGIEIERVELPVGNVQTAETYADLFDARIRALRGQGRRVRAMLWSAPTYQTGTLLPMAELMEVAKTHELISIVDGAHLLGMMDFDYGALGMDFLATAGHKWQCGPGSTGILIARNRIRASNPLPLPDWYPIHTSELSYAAAERGSYDIAARITTRGGMCIPLFQALAAACDMWDELGRKQVETYSLGLSSYLKARIVERWGEHALYSPADDRRLLTAMTSFNPFRSVDDVMDQKKSDEFVARLLTDVSPGFIVRNVNFPVIGAPAEHWGIRISTHLWHDANDIDHLVEAMEQISRRMA